MQRTKSFCLILAIILASTIIGLSQKRTVVMDRLAEAIEQLVQEKHPEWTLKRIEPVYKGEEVIIDQWTAPREYVRVSVVPHRSAGEAKSELQSLARNMKGEPGPVGIGEEVYSWGFGGSETTFRKGRFTVYVSTTVNVDDDPEAAALSDDEKSKRKSANQKKLSKEFAKHVDSALSLPSVRDLF